MITIIAAEGLSLKLDGDDATTLQSGDSSALIGLQLAVQAAIESYDKD